MRYDILQDENERIWLANCQITGNILFFRFGCFQKEIDDEIQIVRTIPDKNNQYAEYPVKLNPIWVNMKTKMISTNNQLEIIL